MKAELQRLKTIYSAFNAFHRKKTVCNYPPQFTGIELTSHCNLNCKFCGRDEVRKLRGFGDMPFNRYTEIVETYPESCRNLRLFHHGEPTQYPRIVDAVQFASEKPYVKSVGFTTNGNFPLEMLYELFEAGITIIEFSFEGTSKEVYEQIRRGGDYDQVDLNIRNAIILKRKYPNTIVRINIVRNNLTEKDLDQFIKYWTQFDLTVDISLLHDWAGNIEVEGLGDYMRHSLPQSCFNPWFTCVIHYNGSVVPCCIWFDDPMGNIFKQDLSTIWNGSTFRYLRKQLSKKREFCWYCKNCYVKPMGKSPYQISRRNPLYPLDLSLLRVIGDGVKRRLTKSQPKIRRVKH